MLRDLFRTGKRGFDKWVTVLRLNPPSYIGIILQNHHKNCNIIFSSLVVCMDWCSMRQNLSHMNIPANLKGVFMLVKPLEKKV